MLRISDDQENPIDLSTYEAWNKHYLKLISSLDILSDTSDSILVKLAIKCDALIQPLQKLDQHFHDYFDMPEFLHEDRMLIMEKIVKSCKTLSEFNVISSTQTLAHEIKQLSTCVNSMLESHQKNIRDINCKNVPRQIGNVLHTYDKANLNIVFNSVTCKSHPGILKKVMLYVTEYHYQGRIHSIQLLKDNGFDINQPIDFTDTSLKYTDLLHYALSHHRNDYDTANEASAFKLLELGSTVKDSHISYAIRNTSQKMVAALLEKRPDYQPSKDDFIQLIELYHDNTVYFDRTHRQNIRSVNIIKLLCDRGTLPPSGILVYALKTGKHHIASILMDEYFIKLPNSLSTVELIEIIKNCSIEILRNLKLKIPEDILDSREKSLPYENIFLYQTLSSEKIQFCVGNGASIQNINFDSKGVLQSPEIVKQLHAMGKKIDLQLKDELGISITLLHYAATHGHPETVKLLILLKLDIHAKTKNGWTPLHYAAAYGNKEAVKVLIQADAECTAVNTEMQTPLHVAACTDGALSTRNIPCAKILLFHGADPDIKDINGKTPLETLYKGGIEPFPRIEQWTNAFKTQPLAAIRTNAQILAQAKRSNHPFFAILDDKALIEIASLMGTRKDKIEINNEHMEMAKNNFCKPGKC